MTTNINNSCSEVLDCIRNSNLNYSCQETPYSLYITVRKSWNKHIQSSNAQLRHVQEDRDRKVAGSNSKNQELSDVKADLESTKKVNDELRTKIETAMADIKHHQSESEEKLSRKDDENKVLKNTLENCKSEKERLKSELKSLQKVLKSKDKEIFNLETFKLNNQDAVSSVKNENEKLKMLEKKKVNLQKLKCPIENNNSIGSSRVSELTSHPSISTSMTEPAVLTLLPDVSRENIPEPKATPPFPVISIPKLGSVSVALAISPSITSSSYSVDNLCDHQPQCVIRQPKPPPADKCSILVHNGSKYHEHFLTSVPARYGPHDNCMAVAYENYGCSDCIWFKKWGELHGYPDLWPFKYIKAGTYSDQLSLTEN